jgi:RNA polymerase sigma-70 factor (ECF subfamily)
MSENLEHSFVKQLKDNQNIIHKICRLYTDCENADSKLRFSCGKLFQNLEAFSTLAYHGSTEHITLYRKQTKCVTVEYEGQQQRLTNYEEEEQILV